MSIPAPFTALLNERYASMRKAARGAQIVLLAEGDGYTTLHADAVKAAPLVTQWATLKDIRASEWDWEEPAENHLTIPTQHVHAALLALRVKFSVALVERIQRAPGEYGSKMVAVWVVEKLPDEPSSDAFDELF